jgi:hypothetical protein
MKLLTRDEFREAVFARDNHKCVMCTQVSVQAKDAHHIMERRLFNDGGYYLDNGVSLCGDCHILSEKTLYTTDQLRTAAGITKVVLPDHLYGDYEYDKWGNIVNPNLTRIRGELFEDESVQKVLHAGGVLNLFSPYVKYPRTFHLPFSYGRTDDDKVIPDCSEFEGQDVVVTLKMDGENTTGYYDGHIHARSIDSDNHASRNWVKNFLSGRLPELPAGWRLCGENLFARHSIHYRDLNSFFYLFSIWDNRNSCLSWDATSEWAQLLNIELVPVLYRGLWDEKRVKELWNETYKGNNMEGYVVRRADAFHYSAFRRSVAKFVRANHVQTNQHWLRTRIERNELCQLE